MDVHSAGTHSLQSIRSKKKNAWRSHDYLLQFFYCDWQLWFCRAWGGKNNAQVYTSAGSFFAFFLPFLLENSYSEKARRDLDREPKAFTHKHMLTCDISRPMNSSPNCYSAVTNRLHSAGSGWRILQIKLDTETTENTDKENGPACCSDCLTSSRNLFSVNTAAAAAFGYVTLQWSAGINCSSSLLKMRGSALQQRT